MSDRYASAFDALADSPEEAADLKIRSQMMRGLTAHLQKLDLTPSETAAKFDAPRQAISDLYLGHIESFTAESLQVLAGKVGVVFICLY